LRGALLCALLAIAAGCAQGPAPKIPNLRVRRNEATSLETLSLEAAHLDVLRHGYGNRTDMLRIDLTLRVTSRHNCLFRFSKAVLTGGGKTLRFHFDRVDYDYGRDHSMTRFPAFNGLVRRGEVRLVPYRIHLEPEIPVGTDVELEIEVFGTNDYERERSRKWRFRTRVREIKAG